MHTPMSFVLVASKSGVLFAVPCKSSPRNSAFSFAHSTGRSAAAAMAGRCPSAGMNKPLLTKTSPALATIDPPTWGPSFFPASRSQLLTPGGPRSAVTRFGSWVPREKNSCRRGWQRLRGSCSVHLGCCSDTRDALLPHSDHTVVGRRPVRHFAPIITIVHLHGSWEVFVGGF